MSTIEQKNLSEIPNRLGRAIQVRRAILQMQRRELAEAAELSYPYICELEKGSKEPSAKSLRQLAAALRFASTSEFLNWVDQVELSPADDSTSGHESIETPDSPPNQWVSLATSAVPTRSWLAQRAVSPGADLEVVLDQAVQRITDRVMDLLTREIPRLVELEVARRIAELQSGR